MKKQIACFLVLLVLCLPMVSCQTSDELERLTRLGMEGNGEGVRKENDEIMDRGPEKGGVLRVFTTQPDTLNPVLTRNSYVQDFLSFVYESMVRLDSKQQPEPLLADRWSVSEDCLTWNFHIRSHMTWHDGQPISAQDVEFTVETILNSRVDSIYKSIFDNIATFAAVDNENFKVVLRRPNSFFAEMMTFPVLPKHKFQKAGFIAANKDFKPVGSGPYKFVSFDGESKVVLKANPDWWYLKQPGIKTSERMYIGEINVMVYPSSKEVINAFQTGDIDVACIDADELGKYVGRTDLIMKKYPSRNYEFLTFNLTSPIFGDKAVRHAIATTIDKDDLLKSVYQGGAAEADLPVNPHSWLADDAATDRPDLANARTILEENGWKLDDKGYYKVIGSARKDLKLELLVNNNNSYRVSAAGVIADQLTKAGIPATVVELPWEELLARLDSRKYDLAMMGCRITSIPDLSFLYDARYLTSFQPVNGDAGRNIAGYQNADVNAHIGRIFGMSDTERRKTEFVQMKRILDDEVPYIGLYFLNNAVIYRKNVRGSLLPHTWNKYWDITRWYMPDLQ